MNNLWLKDILQEELNEDIINFLNEYDSIEEYDEETIKEVFDNHGLEIELNEEEDILEQYENYIKSIRSSGKKTPEDKVKDIFDSIENKKELFEKYKGNKVDIDKLVLLEISKIIENFDQAWEIEYEQRLSDLHDSELEEIAEQQRQEELEKEQALEDEEIENEKPEVEDLEEVVEEEIEETELEDDELIEDGEEFTLEEELEEDSEFDPYKEGNFDSFDSEDDFNGEFSEDSFSIESEEDFESNNNENNFGDYQDNNDQFNTTSNSNTVDQSVIDSLEEQIRTQASELEKLKKQSSPEVKNLEKQIDKLNKELKKVSKEKKQKTKEEKQQKSSDKEKRARKILSRTAITLNIGKNKKEKPSKEKKANEESVKGNNDKDALSITEEEIKEIKQYMETLKGVDIEKVISEINENKTQVQDPFGNTPQDSSDPFASAGQSDPFGNMSQDSSDPFASAGQSDPFGNMSQDSSDPFASAGQADPFGSVTQNSSSEAEKKEYVSKEQMDDVLLQIEELKKKLKKKSSKRNKKQEEPKEKQKEMKPIDNVWDTPTFDMSNMNNSWGEDSVEDKKTTDKKKFNINFKFNKKKKIKEQPKDEEGGGW